MTDPSVRIRDHLDRAVLYPHVHHCCLVNAFRDVLDFLDYAEHYGDPITPSQVRRVMARGLGVFND